MRTVVFPNQRRLLPITLPTPLVGDVVVRSCEDCPTDYALCPDPSPAQFRCSAYARAIDVAKRWARRQHVDVWFAEGTKTFTLLSRHRLDEPKTSSWTRGVRRTSVGPFHNIGAVWSDADMNFEHDPVDARSVIGLPHPNVLLVGSAAAAEELIMIFGPHFAPPVVEWDPCVRADLPSISCGTLILWHVDRMQPREQQRLDAFVGGHWRGVQIVSVADGELFDRVQRGEFLESLYYRLNVLRIHVNDITTSQA